MPEYIFGPEFVHTIEVEDHSVISLTIVDPTEQPQDVINVIEPSTVITMTPVLGGSLGGGSGTTTWAGITDKPSTFPPDEHDHDDRYIRTVNNEGPDEDGNVTVATDVGEVDWDNVENKPSAFPPDTHNHDDRYYTEDETDTLLSGKQASGSYAAATHNHTAAQTTSGTFDAARIPTLAQSKITNLTTDLAGKAASTHTHTTSQITDFNTSVDARIENIIGSAPDALDTLEELAAALGNDEDYAATITTELAGKVSTTRTINGKALSSNVTLTPDDFTDGTTNHVFTAADDTKLAGIATSATANSADATLLARTNHTGSQAISTITGLQTALDGKAASSHSHTIANVTGLQAALDGKSATSHNHDSVYYTKSQVDSLVDDAIAAAFADSDTLRAALEVITIDEGDTPPTGISIVRPE